MAAAIQSKTGVGTGCTLSGMLSPSMRKRHAALIQSGLDIAIVDARDGGAGGGSRTHTSCEALRIFLPSAAFAALTKSCQLKVGFAVWTIPSSCPGRARG